MLVDVVLMRAGGEKLSADQLRAGNAIRGRLTLASRPWREQWQPHIPRVLTTFAYLFDHLDDDPIAQPLLELRDARMTQHNEIRTIVVGIERTGIEWHYVDQPQAWWCRRFTA